ncbi:hypothetical protein EKTHUN627_15940 [Enterobacter kobei]|nr:hypothetical protein EKTHUN627_15940 [Enterobacter kobei]
MPSRKEIIPKARYMDWSVSGSKHCRVAASPYPAYKSAVPRRSGKAPPPDTKKASTKLYTVNLNVYKVY